MTESANTRKMEVLAPAGNLKCLQAALKAGANAVYFGLKHLNARRGAENFLPEDLAEVVQIVHAAGAKAYLTLNIDIHQRELGLAARTLALAEKSGVDAVLVRDPALLAMRQSFPKLTFHFSTQAAVTTSAGVMAAQKLGISRVVLAREMTNQEIAAATRAPGMETEVFVQGALCFACSGRCLLSSWVGGRSGNRGACASPCRVPWSNQDGETGHPLSMHDLSLLDHLPELQKAGVASLKIEGRLKAPEWVAKAVAIYQQALSQNHDQLSNANSEVEKLGGYTGRKLTDGYFVGQMQNLTGTAARPTLDETNIIADDDAADEDPTNTNHGWQIKVTEDDRGATFWTFSCALQSITHRTAPQRIANPRRAIAIADILTNMQSLLPQDNQPHITLTMPELSQKLLPRQAGKAATEALAAFQRQTLKVSDGLVRQIKLPPAVASMLIADSAPCPANKRQLGQSADTCRLTLAQWQSLSASQTALYRRWIVTCLPLNDLQAQQQMEALLRFPGLKPIVALPAVFYEEHIPALQKFLQLVRAANLTVEVNSWDGWHLTTEAKLPMLAGPGMPVLNALAASQLQQLGCEMTTVSSEIDQNQLENLCAAANTPLAITVFSYPTLMCSRAMLPDAFASGDSATLTDNRGTVMRVSQTGPLTVLRPEQPFDWRSLRNERVKAAHFVIDLCGAPTPLQLRPPAETAPFLFNYDRKLR